MQSVGRDAHLRVSRHCLWRRRDMRGPLHAKSSRGLEAGRLDADGGAGCRNDRDRDYTLGEALRTWQWWALCALLSINTIAGISVVSQAAPMFQELGKVSAVTAASFVGIISLGNGLGRVLWAWISDMTGRKTAFFADVSDPGGPLLDFSQHQFADHSAGRHFRHPGCVTAAPTGSRRPSRRIILAPATWGRFSG